MPTEFPTMSPTPCQVRIDERERELQERIRELETQCSGKTTCDACTRDEIIELKLQVRGVEGAVDTFETCTSTASQMEKLDEAMLEMRKLMQMLQATNAYGWRKMIMEEGTQFCKHVPTPICSVTGLCRIVGDTCEPA